MNDNHSEGQTLTMIRFKYVADNKVPYKHLADLEFVDSVPKNPSGKLLRRVLRDKARAARTPAKTKM
jgi:4-coumarate--CoA ligase